MGHVRKILALKKIQPIPTFYSDKLAIELSEDFHLHLRNIRIESDHVEFEKIAKAFCKALDEWNKLGRPTKKEKSWKRGNYHELSVGKIQSIPLLFNNEVINDELRIEVQKWADCVHLHYKELRIEFTIREFEELVDVVKEASDKLKEHSEDNPERFGKFQRACPNERVMKRVNKKGFWLKSSDNVADKPYDSTYSEEDSRADTRITSDPKLAKLDIRDLFDITLYHSLSAHPWGCDENGILLPLLYRYQFAKMVFESSKDLTNDEIKSTNYWNLLSKKITDRPRDGGGGWIYENPMEQCQRFISIIKSIKKYGYLGIERGHVSYKEFETTPKIIEENGKVSNQRNNEGGFPGLISVAPSSGAYKINNGLHRLAILKYLWDTGQLSSPLILVRKRDDSSFGPSDITDIKYDDKGYPIGRIDNFIDRVKEPLARKKNKALRVTRRLLNKR